MRSLYSGLARLVLWVALAIAMFPILWVLLTSFKPSDISQALPPIWNFSPTLQNYRDVLTGNTYTSQVFGVLIVHSLIVTLASSSVSASAAAGPATLAPARPARAVPIRAMTSRRFNACPTRIGRPRVVGPS